MQLPQKGSYRQILSLLEEMAMSRPRVQDHYATAGIVDRALAALRAVHGAQTPATPEILAPMDHFHGRGFLATEELALSLDPQATHHILDIGCGIGGPARWIAHRYVCRVTGIDLTPEFCEAARQLNDITGMSQRVTILQGSALSLPLPDVTFDRAYSQNALMNIEDKTAFYCEAFRVLKPGGILVLAHLNAGPNGPPDFPQPWASIPENSFLADDDGTKHDLAVAGFEMISFDDHTATSLASQIAFRNKIEAEGLPPLGVHVLFGPEFRQLQLNSMRALEDGRIRPVQIVVRKPS
jgi:sarcosine/dimethylglycine N-methyltransferase